MCTSRRALKIVIFVWIFAILYSSPWLWLTATFPIFYRDYPPLKMCDYKLSREEYLGYYFTDLVLFYLIPLLLCILLYTKIAISLITQPFNGGSPAVTRAANGEAVVDFQPSNRTSNRTQVVKMLAIVSALFAVLWLPYRGLLVYNSVAEEKFMNIWYLMGAKSCIYLNRWDTFHSKSFHKVTLTFTECSLTFFAFVQRHQSHSIQCHVHEI